MRARFWVLGFGFWVFPLVSGCTAEAPDDAEETEDVAASFLFAGSDHWGRPPLGHHPGFGHHRPKPLTGSCRATSEGAVTTITVQTGTVSGVRVRDTIRGDHSTGSVTIDKVVTRLGREIITVHSVGGPQGSETSAAFAAPIRGIRSASATSDGTTIAGSIDGRALVPLPVTTDSPTLTFVDGRPAPRVHAPFGLRHALNTLADQETALLESCLSDGSTSDTPQAAAQVGNTGHISIAVLTSDCRECSALCWLEGAIEAALCNSVPVLGLVLCTAFDTYRVISCVNSCYDVGEGCCPVGCGSGGAGFSGNGCCLSGETCLNPDGRLCCSSDEITCGGIHCCASGSQVCLTGTGGSQCCESSDVCGTACCQASEGFSCKDPSTSQCCKSGQECGTGCCASDLGTGRPLETCVDASLSLCCASIHGPVCGGQCCPIGFSCDNGTCAEPTAQDQCPESACSEDTDCFELYGFSNNTCSTIGCCIPTVR